MLRGFSCIGLVRPKDKSNVGSAIRAATCYNSKFVAVENARNDCVTHGSNTTQGHKHNPVFMTDDLMTVRPFDTQLVVVELLDDAQSLVDFVHPERAMYMFGPEDGTLGIKHTKHAQHKVFIPTSHCMNLAATVNVVLYDRMMKQMQKKEMHNAA